jgi:hypothetical protein
MKIKILTDVKVIADISKGMSWYINNSIENKAKQMQSLASEFNDFVRDHRSMDWVRLEVEKEYTDCCSFCKYEWEVDKDGVPACCQDAILEFESKQAESKS